MEREALLFKLSFSFNECCHGLLSGYSLCRFLSVRILCRKSVFGLMLIPNYFAQKNLGEISIDSFTISQIFWQGWSFSLFHGIFMIAPCCPHF